MLLEIIQSGEVKRSFSGQEIVKDKQLSELLGLDPVIIGGAMVRGGIPLMNDTQGLPLLPWMTTERFPDVIAGLQDVTEQMKKLPDYSWVRDVDLNASEIRVQAPNGNEIRFLR